MAITRSLVFPDDGERLTDDQKRKIDLAETALDALLQLHGSVSLQLVCTRNSRIRQGLTDKYV